jgi:putative tricarboxylic transport membrane protein
LAIVIVLVAVGLMPGALDGRSVAAQECDYPTDTLQIMAPAAPGGGWDTTAREIQQVLEGGIIDQTVEVFNVEGAGGTIGLAQLVNDNAGDPNTLMVMGMVMIGAIETNQSETTLDEVTPIASLTAEYEVVVVPKDSEYQTLQDLVDDLKADPGSVSWAGGSAGGTDHILVGLIAKAVGVDPTAINYVPYSGGGEALAAILGNQVSAGVSGLGEWQDQIASGDLRVLAISSEAPVDDGATPAAATPAAEGLPAMQTLQEQGVDVALANWRGIVAAPDITDEQRTCITEMIQAMHDSDGWKAVLAKYGWQDYFKVGAEFDEFLPAERERIVGILQELGLVA